MTDKRADEPYVQTFEDRLDWKIFDQLHHVVLQISGFSFRTKQIGLTIEVALIGLLIKFTDNHLDEAIFVTGAVVPAGFWLLDSVTYFYQSKMRGLMTEIEKRLMSRNGVGLVAPELLVLTDERATISSRKKLLRAIFNHSMWIYPCLIIADAILWFGYCHKWIHA